MTIHWVSAFIDVPAESFDASVAFWAEATRTTPSARRGERDQFLTLEPADGTAALRMQVHQGAARMHMDLHVDGLGAYRDRAVAHGATVLEEPGHVIMASPGGLVFCLVDGTGDEHLGSLLDEPVPHRVDQLCIDIPAGAFESEIAFWDALTGWGTGRTQLAQFRSLDQPPHIPYRFLFQQLGDDDGRAAVHVHLDISCGGQNHPVRDRHADLGAEVGESQTHWTVMRDPAGLEYCVTNREPFTAM